MFTTRRLFTAVTAFAAALGFSRPAAGGRPGRQRVGQGLRSNAERQGDEAIRVYWQAS